MRYYESLYIVNSNYEQSRINDIMKEVENKCDEYKLKIINHHIWGKKRLAYNIDKHKYGSFILLNFETTAINSLQEFDRFMILHNNVLRNQTVYLDKKPEIINNDEAQQEEPNIDDKEKNNLTKEAKVVDDGIVNDPPVKEEKKEN